VSSEGGGPRSGSAGVSELPGSVRIGERSPSNRRPRWTRLRWSRGGILFVLAAVYALAAITAPGFFAHDNQQNVLRNVSVLGVMAVGQTVVAITGGLADVSSGSIVSLSAVLALGMQSVLGAWGAVGFAVVAGIAVGVVNGLLVGPMRTNPVVATIGTGVVVEGLALGYTAGTRSTGGPAVSPTWVAGQAAASPTWLSRSWSSLWWCISSVATRPSGSGCQPRAATRRRRERQPCGSDRSWPSPSSLAV
jgi:ribose/xylose/arabinose/galactoside ABC-type transport system permease subunit